MSSEERFLQAIFYYMKFRQRRTCRNKKCPIEKIRDLHVSLDFMVENSTELNKLNKPVVEDHCVGDVEFHAP